MPESLNSLYAASDFEWIEERQNMIIWGWYLFPNFGDASIFRCCFQKTLMCGVTLFPSSASIVRISFSKVSSTEIFWIFFQAEKYDPLLIILCRWTVATNRSLLDLDRGALSFRGTGCCILLFSFCLPKDVSCLAQLEQELSPKAIHNLVT